MTSFTLRDTQYMEEKLEPYRNWVLQGLAVDTTNEAFGLSLECPVSGDRVILWVDQDQEGNGPGWISPQEVKKEDDDGS